VVAGDGCTPGATCFGNVPLALPPPLLLTQRSLQAPVDRYSMRPIARAQSCFRISRDTPRQGGLAPETRAKLVLERWTPSEALCGMEQFSHVWVVFVFDTNNNEASRALAATTVKGRRAMAKVKPPALGGAKVGTLTTRSPHRPNAIGLTLVRIVQVCDGKQVFQGPSSARETSPAPDSNGWLLVSGVDFTEGTPILDIKPHVPAYDSSPDATVPSWVATRADDSKARVRPVFWRDGAAVAVDAACAAGLCRLYGSGESKELRAAISQVLSCDVRSGFQRAGKSGRIDSSAPSVMWLDGITVSYSRLEVPLAHVRDGRGPLVGTRPWNSPRWESSDFADTYDGYVVVIESALHDDRTDAVGSFSAPEPAREATTVAAAASAAPEITLDVPPVAEDEQREAFLEANDPLGSRGATSMQSTHSSCLGKSWVVVEDEGDV
jgi:tRNA-Thr(GGU) m(6)t(6)A37 methyltransferase TsaA